MKIVYVAHPLGSGPDREQNRRNAAEWCAFFAEHYNIAPVADWIVLSGIWDEQPNYRWRGIEIDKALVARCDEVWLCGGRISPGMQIEKDTAARLGVTVRDWTGCGYRVPAVRPEYPVGLNPTVDRSITIQIETAMNSTPGQGGPG